MADANAEGGNSGERGVTRRRRGIMESLLTVVHSLEVAALGFGALAMWGVTRDWPAPLAFVGVAVLLVVMIPLLRRSWGWVASLVGQVLLASLTVIEPIMALVAIAFIAMWIFCFVRARQIERSTSTPS